MSKLFDVALEWLNQEEWSFSEHRSDDSDNAWIKANYVADNARFDIVFDVYEDIEIFSLYIYFPVNVPENKRLAVADLLTRINWGMRVGNFELNMDDGLIRCKAVVDIEGSTLVTTMITNMLRAVLSTADKYFPMIMQVCYSDKTAKDLLATEDSALTEEVKTLQ
ncbi:MAG TPA: YbjN domain-containing protein [Agitococcus sp.]|nr:YbjN domain-containing protein [Agitococcus sp.]